MCKENSCIWNEEMVNCTTIRRSGNGNVSRFTSWSAQSVLSACLSAGTETKRRHKAVSANRAIECDNAANLQLKLLTCLLTDLITYSMQQGPFWESKHFCACQEIPCILWNPKAHCRINKCQSTVPILSQFDPVHDKWVTVSRAWSVFRFGLKICLQCGRYLRIYWISSCGQPRRGHLQLCFGRGANKSSP